MDIAAPALHAEERLDAEVNERDLIQMRTTGDSFERRQARLRAC